MKQSRILTNLLENDLMEKTQCIVDIYSRYLFETAVFEQSRTGFLMAEDLNELMLKAQKEKAMLKATPTCTIEEAGAMMGVDLSDKKFWLGSLKLIAKDIEEFCGL